MPATDRCPCHPADVYGGLVRCPSCGHWSLDDFAGACERRACGFSVDYRDFDRALQQGYGGDWLDWQMGGHAQDPADWPKKIPKVFPRELKVEGGSAENIGVSNRTDAKDTTMARSTSTYGKTTTAPTYGPPTAPRGLCPTHRTPILSDDTCWECGPDSTPAPARPAVTGNTASPKQLDFLRKLFAERTGSEAAVAIRTVMLAAYKRGEFTGKLASQAISAVLEIPKDQAATSTPATTTTTSTVPAGHYAVASATGNNDLDFFRVDCPTEGKWAGRTFVKRVIGGHEDTPVRGAEAASALARITAAGPVAAGRLYGQEIGRCYVCHRTLTDESSRAAGIGPDCASREG